MGVPPLWAPPPVSLLLPSLCLSSESRRLAAPGGREATPPQRSPWLPPSASYKIQVPSLSYIQFILYALPILLEARSHF